MRALWCLCLLLICNAWAQKVESIPSKEEDVINSKESKDEPIQSSQGEEQVEEVEGMGFFKFTSPIGPSVYWIVGNTYNITWDYTSVTKYPRKSITLEFANKQGSTQSWNLIETLSPSARSYAWKVPNTVDGNYKLRLHADGLSTVIEEALDIFWFGFPRPTESVLFTIGHRRSLPSAPDEHAPNAGFKNDTHLLLLFLLLLCIF